MFHCTVTIISLIETKLKDSKFAERKRSLNKRTCHHTVKKRKPHILLLVIVC